MGIGSYHTCSVNPSLLPYMGCGSWPCYHIWAVVPGSATIHGWWFLALLPYMGGGSWPCYHTWAVVPGPIPAVYSLPYTAISSCRLLPHINIGSDLSLGMEVFLNLRMVTETSCSRSQPRRLSGFLQGVPGSDFDVEALSYTHKHKRIYKDTNSTKLYKPVEIA